MARQAALGEQVVLELGHGGARQRGQVAAVQEDLVLVGEVRAQKVLVAELLLAQVAVGVRLQQLRVGVAARHRAGRVGLATRQRWVIAIKVKIQLQNALPII